MASYVISSGEVSSGINLGNWDNLTVESGGTAVKTMAKDDGDIYVRSGGLAISTTVSSGGWMTADGDVSETKLMAGNLVLYGSAVSTIVSGMDFLNGNNRITEWGSFYVGYSGYASANQIYSAGSMMVAGYAISNTVYSGGIIEVINEGKISSTTISSGARLDIGGTTANKTTVYSGGMVNGFLIQERQTIQSGIHLSNVIAEGWISSGDLEFLSAYVYVGQTVTSATIKAGAYVEVAGAASETIILSGGSMTVSAGEGTATAVNTTINSGGNMTVFAYFGTATATDTTVNSGGSMTVSRGGSATGITVNSGGDMYVDLDGSATGITVNSGGKMAVNRYGLVSGTTVHSGGIVNGFVIQESQTIRSGVHISNAIAEGKISSDYSEIRYAYVDVGQTVTSATIKAGAYVEVAGAASETIIQSGGVVEVFGDGSANRTTVNSGGSMTVREDGSATGITVNSGGKLEVFRIANSKVFLNDLQIKNGGSAVFNSQSIVNIAGRMVIENGGTVTASEDGIRINLSIVERLPGNDYLITGFSGITGSYTVSVQISDAMEEGTYKLATDAANFPKTVTVVNQDGGVYGNLTVNGETLTHDDMSFTLKRDGSGNLTLTTEGQNAAAVLSVSATPGRLTNQNVTVTAVFSKNTDTKQYSLDEKTWKTYEDGGVVLEDNGTVYFRGLDTKEKPSEVKSITVDWIDKVPPEAPVVSADITEPTNQAVTLTAVYSDDTAVKEFSMDGTKWETYIDGVTVIENGIVYFRGIDGAGNLSRPVSYVVDNIIGNVVSGDQVKVYSSSVLVISAGELTGEILAGGGNNSMSVTSGGKVNGTTVDSGGRLQISSGGLGIQTTVTSEGIFNLSGGHADRTQVNSGGRLIVSSGGTALETAVYSGGLMYVLQEGSASGTITQGYLYVRGGRAEDTTVNDGGRMYLTSGGSGSGAVLNSGAYLFVSLGGIIERAAVDSNARLQIGSGGKLTGSLEINSGAMVSAYSGSIIDFDISARTAGSPALVNDLSLIYGTPSYTITVSANQAEGIYMLADGANGFAQPVTICNTDGVCSSLAVGGTVTLGDLNYALKLDSSLLTLTVSGGSPIPPTPVVGGTAGDLNMDGRADIIMTIDQDGHSADGSTGAWLIQENQTAEWGDLSTRNSGWTIFGTGKTAAGKNTDDVYIRSEGNIVGAWTTGDDGQVNGWETIGEFSSETQIIGLGDFNGNGQSDLLLRNNNGAVGCFFTSEEKHGWNYFQSLGSEWQLSAIGDFNGDGRDDVVLNHDAGFAGSWLTQSDGTMAWADLDTLPDGFEIVGAGDFNGDGTDDVLLKNGNYYGAWLVNNGNAAGWMGLGDLGDVTVEQIADFNGDGKDDLRIRTAAGDLGAQLVMGADTLDWHYYGSVGAEWKTGLAALS